MDFFSNFHRDTIDYGLLSNSHSNTIDRLWILA